MDVERIRRKYERNARFYDLLRGPTARLRRIAIERMTLHPGEVVLDLGCGTGLSFELLEKAIGPGGRIIGFDVSPDMLARAREKVTAHGWTNVTLVEANVEEARLEPQSVDAVLSFYTHDIMHSRRALGVAVDALRTGGRCTAAGAKLTSGIRGVVLNPITVAYSRPAVTDLSGMDRPWVLLERLLGRLEVEEHLWGTAYVARGVKPSIEELARRANESSDRTSPVVQGPAAGFTATGPSDEGSITGTFCFVDMAGFSALTEAHGDAAAARFALRLAELVEQALGGGGRLVKIIGDAAFVVTPTPEHAVRFVSRLWATATEEADFPVLRAGLHHGEAVERGADVFGAAVNLAARVAAQAKGGQTLATRVVADAARVSGIGVTPLGRTLMRNVREAVDLFALNLAPETQDVVDPVCRMRVSSVNAAGHLRVDGVDYWFCSLDCVRAFAADPESYRRSAR
jgi:class 3 adenylate cyclase/YHS domain-containing protein